MPFLITALVGFMVLPASAAAPVPMDVTVATTTTSVQARSIVADTKAPAFTVKLTGYNAVPSQTDDNPFTTASGAYSNPEVVAARSEDLASKLPFGTIVEIERTASDTPACNYQKVQPQIGYRVIADAMNPRITNTVDVLLDQHDTVSYDGTERNPALVLGMCTSVTVRVVGRIPVKDIPETQGALAALVNPVSAKLAQR